MKSLHVILRHKNVLTGLRHNVFIIQRLVRGSDKNTKCFVLTHSSYLSIWVLDTPLSSLSVLNYYS